MAGAPRRVSGGGLTGLHYGLITFVVISVACLAGFIYQLTIVKGFEEEAQRHKKRLESYGEPPAYYQDEATARRSTVFSVMDGDRRALVTLVTGVPEDVAASVKQQTDLVVDQVRLNHPGVVNEGDALLTVIRNMDRRLTAARREAENRAEEARKLQQENQNLAESIKAVKDDFTAKLDALNDRLKQVSAEFASALEQKDTQLRGIQTSENQAREDLAKAEQDARLKQKEFELELATLRNRVEQLQEEIAKTKPSAFDPEDILTKADGKVLRAIPGSPVIYVNLGEEDGIKIGMGFEVFSQTLEQRESLRGKASVEVTALQPHSAECRVTRTEPGRPIIEGDIIVNISYERNRKPKFVLTGAFDLNYDGVEDFDGVDKIAAMIREWGGQVVPALDTTTDFVIVGAAPRAPAVLEADTEVVAEQKRAAAEELNQFRELILEARALFVPVINQNQFLFLTGYAGEGAFHPH